MYSQFSLEIFLLLWTQLYPPSKVPIFFSFHVTWSPTESNTTWVQLLRTFDEGLKRTGRTYGLLRRMTIVSFMDRNSATYVCK